MVKRNAAEPWPDVSKINSGTIGRLNHAVTAAVKEGVGRSVATYLLNLSSEFG